MTYYVQRNYEEAIPHFEKAIELGKQSEEYFYELGFSYAYLGQCDRAMTWFQEALALNPGSAVAKQGIAYCQDRSP